MVTGDRGPSGQVLLKQTKLKHSQEADLVTIPLLTLEAKVALAFQQNLAQLTFVRQFLYEFLNHLRKPANHH